MKDKRQDVEEAEAAEYAAHPELFTILSLTLQVQSERRMIIVSYHANILFCTCNDISPVSECRHVMAAKMLYFQKVCTKGGVTSEPL